MSSQGARIIYKRLLRYGRSLTYTNKDYFYRRVRFEFEKNSVVKNPEEISYQLKKAETFLVNKWLV